MFCFLNLFFWWGVESERCLSILMYSTYDASMFNLLSS